MLFTFLRKQSRARPDIVVIANTASVLVPHAMAVQRSWQPAWSQADLFSTLALAMTRHQGMPASPLDKAIDAYVVGKGASVASGEPMATYPFATVIAMSGNAWHHGREYKLAIKGAPEAIMACCDLTESEREDIQKAAAGMAAEGHQVVAAAHAVVRSAPPSLGKAQQKNTLTFTGLISTSAVLNPKAHEAVQNALRAGISVRMLSGGRLETAYAIGRQLGLVSARSQALDSRTLRHMNLEAAENAIKNTLIFAEATPADKNSIMRLLKKDHTVAVIDSDTNNTPLP